MEIDVRQVIDLFYVEDDAERKLTQVVQQTGTASCRLDTPYRPLCINLN